MGKVEKRSVALSSELAATIDAAVQSGEYGSASEVVREALRHWKERRDLLGYTLEELRASVQEGLGSGAAKPLDDALFTRIKQQGRAP